MKQVSGFTLVELMFATAIAALLAVTAVPTFQASIQKSRRPDAITALYRLQLSQERWRADHPTYATEEDLPHGLASPQGHYRLAISSPTETGFTLSATAQGAQASDRDCKVMRISQHRGETIHSSGPDADRHNASAVNLRCWNQ